MDGSAACRRTTSTCASARRTPSTSPWPCSSRAASQDQLADRLFRRALVSGGIAHPHGDGSAWCRIPHAVLCPRRTLTCRMSPGPDGAPGAAGPREPSSGLGSRTRSPASSTSSP
ncbi:DUF6083 domain-containing protein [Streptomyces sp. DSM 15324]|uniref:DUF6083 domain-containing protein n=1 Tax=Streptomyces sp. DSM 15324 TaxID=1739111 RepID=UPI00099E3FCE|nr:DUF6083 domain-containing protein [Streptomyces sp. DSM 15324]